ncbi:hypothetical protein [Streptomyces sp. NBRC 109706]|uniref:hypothetical protein n=1 Tax=Streptomyces sp. NBRC 109706 TaxID=1550035 RepID=UPI00082C1C42|nr:hypothetical protein [Streptomyces sp. NBRC 109706]
MSEQAELSVHHIVSTDPNGAVCVVRCLAGPARRGTVFRVADAEFRLDEIEWYGRQVDSLDPAHHGKVRLTGPTTDHLRPGAVLTTP